MFVPCCRPADHRERSWQAADVQLIDLTEVAAWHIDPDRRPTGPRTTSLEWSSPSLDIIERMLVVNENAAIKLAPASRVPDAWSATCEREWISRGGECRQQVVWHGGLARSPGLRRATVLRTPASTSGEPRSPPRTIVGEANQSAPIAAAVQQYVFDVDAAVLAAHLKGALAAEHGLQLLAGGASYLTGASPIVVDEALTCFEVDDVLPLRVPAVARYLSARGVGRLEIKKRGVDVDPERLRREFKLRGDHEATLLISPVGDRPAAIVASRLRNRADSPGNEPSAS